MPARSTVVLAIAVLALSTSAVPASMPAPRTYTVIIDKMKFGPVPSGLRVGDKIRWINRDLFRHTATATNRSFEIDLLPATEGTLVLKRAGTITFFCKFHPGMRGQLVVRR